MTRAAIQAVACKLPSSLVGCGRLIFVSAVSAVLLVIVGCGGWVYPEAQDPAAVRAHRKAAMRPQPPPRGDDVGDESPQTMNQPMTPAARLLAHDVRIRLDTRTLGYPGAPGFDVIEIYIAALDVEEYAAALEMYSVPGAAAALFQPDTGENRERFHRQAMGSAETLHFQPNGASALTIGRTSGFWSSAAEKNAVGLFLAASLPDGGIPVRLLSLEKGSWPGRRVDLSLASTGWTLLSTPKRTR